MKKSEVLRAARALIEDPAHWTQGEFARNQNDVPRSTRDEDAVKFCAFGALIKVCNPPNDSRIADMPLLDFLNQAALVVYHHPSVSVLNDHGTHEQVLQMFDKAIGYAEEEERE